MKIKNLIANALFILSTTCSHKQTNKNEVDKLLLLAFVWQVCVCVNVDVRLGHVAGNVVGRDRVEARLQSPVESLLVNGACVCLQERVHVAEHPLDAAKVWRARGPEHESVPVLFDESADLGRQVAA